MEQMEPCPFCGCCMELEIGRYPNGDIRMEPHGHHDDVCPLQYVSWHTYPEDGWTPERIISVWNMRHER